MPSLSNATWADINGVRDGFRIGTGGSVEEVAERFARLFATAFSSVVLARVFVVFRLDQLPPAERAFALRSVPSGESASDSTLVLTLLGTAGRDAAWNDRKNSRDHLAIPLLNRTFIEGVPMLARLLADLDVDLAGLEQSSSILTRRLLGGRNGTFYVPDAATAADEQGRLVIPSREFVTQHRVKTVFGMGGAYLDGTLAVSIVFSDESIDRSVVDRYPSFISNFKMASAAHQESGRLFRS